jgi:hypothetical protein
MASATLKPDPHDRRAAWIDAVVSMILLALAWAAVGWMGFVLVDPDTSDSERVVAIAAAAVYQAAAFALLIRGRRFRR